VPDDPPFGPLQFTSDEVESVLLSNRSLTTSVFTDRWKVSYVTPIFKKGRRNNVEGYRGVAILSAIPKRFELLVCRGMNTDL
jgi:hypothetical protein